MHRLLAALIVVIGFTSVAAPAVAQQDGALIALHTFRKEGRSICVVDHYHLGSSYGLRSKKAAKRAALRDWSSFTAWEYGNHWGSTRRAKNRTMDCKRGSSGWACDFNARPCKPARGSRTARRRR
ncbi:MAG: hypothetical protein AAFY64_01125 [Pseudomonadota bacterium]